MQGKKWILRPFCPDKFPAKNNFLGKYIDIGEF